MGQGCFFFFLLLVGDFSAESVISDSSVASFVFTLTLAGAGSGCNSLVDVSSFDDACSI